MTPFERWLADRGGLLVALAFSWFLLCAFWVALRAHAQTDPAHYDLACAQPRCTVTLERGVWDVSFPREQTIAPEERDNETLYVVHTWPAGAQPQAGQ